MSKSEVRAPSSEFKSSSFSFLGRIGIWDGLGLLGALVIVFVAFSITAPNFLSADNLLNVLQQAAFFGIVAVAMTLVIVAGEIDISVGSSAAFASALLGVLVVNEGWPLWISCVVILIATSLIGAGAGWIRARFGVPTFIITLALYLALRGAALLMTNAFSIPIDPNKFFFWGTGKIFGGVPVAAIYLLVWFVVIAIIAQRTVFGRSIYAVGGNAKAAQLSGIRVTAIRIAVMAFTGLAAGFTGLLQSAQLASGNPTIGVGLEFDAIAAVIIGGASLAGGRGTVVGTIMGVLFIAILSDGMVLLGVNTYAQNVVRGALVLGAVLISALRRDRVAKAS